MQTLATILNRNAVEGIETIEPELHNLVLEAGYTGIADYVRKHPLCVQQKVSEIRATLIMQICGIK